MSCVALGRSLPSVPSQSGGPPRGDRVHHTAGCRGTSDPRRKSTVQYSGVSFSPLLTYHPSPGPHDLRDPKEEVSGDVSRLALVSATRNEPRVTLKSSVGNQEWNDSGVQSYWSLESWTRLFRTHRDPLSGTWVPVPVGTKWVGFPVRPVYLSWSILTILTNYS